MRLPIGNISRTVPCLGELHGIDKSASSEPCDFEWPRTYYGSIGILGRILNLIREESDGLGEHQSSIIIKLKMNLL